MGVLGYRRSGECDLWVLSAGRVKMDGGAVFGVVPKSLWEKKLPADEKNRVPLGMNCLLVRFGKRVVLIETGFGGKLSDKMKRIFALDESDGLPEAFREVGIAPGEVSGVILTHLHQDHAGGCTLSAEEGYAPAFPNATYYVQRGEWQDAETADAQTAKGYLPEQVMHPLVREGVVTFLDGDETLFPGIRVEVVPGHTRRHQVVFVDTEKETFCFVGDLISTIHHLKPIYVLAYDLYPRETFLNKKRLMERAFAHGWVMVWPHDLDTFWGWLERDEGGEFSPRSLGEGGCPA